jgi:L-glyceraldehyde 3-phosphate reductase
VCGGWNAIALTRGQSLAQMALAWVLRDPRMTSTVIGASHPTQVEENVRALERSAFTAEELAAIDGFAQEGDVNLWAKPSHDQRP